MSISEDDHFINDLANDAIMLLLGAATAVGIGYAIDNGSEQKRINDKRSEVFYKDINKDGVDDFVIRDIRSNSDYALISSDQNGHVVKAKMVIRHGFPEYHIPGGFFDHQGNFISYDLKDFKSQASSIDSANNR